MLFLILIVITKCLTFSNFSCLYTNINTFSAYNDNNMYFLVQGYGFDVFVTNNSCIPGNRKYYYDVYPKWFSFYRPFYKHTTISSFFCQ